MINIPDKKTDLFWASIFIIYFIFLFLVVILKFRGSLDSILYNIDYYQTQRIMGELNLNLVPFKQISGFIANPQMGSAILNLIGNTIPFMPLGFLIPMAFQRLGRFWKTMYSCLVIILFIEIFQFFSLTGVFDIDDIILNMIGCAFGYGIYYCIRQLQLSRRE